MSLPEAKAEHSTPPWAFRSHDLWQCRGLGGGGLKLASSQLMTIAQLPMPHDSWRFVWCFVWCLWTLELALLDWRDWLGAFLGKTHSVWDCFDIASLSFQPSDVSKISCTCRCQHLHMVTVMCCFMLFHPRMSPDPAATGQHKPSSRWASLEVPSGWLSIAHAWWPSVTPRSISLYQMCRQVDCIRLEIKERLQEATWWTHDKAWKSEDQENDNRRHSRP